MTRLPEAAAGARLAAAWETVLGEDPASQQIIHVLARPSSVDLPAWLVGFAPFEAWARNGCRADEETWLAFAGAAATWPYVRSALRARAAGIPNVRILILKRTGWESAPPWQRYLSEVHAPATSALAGEALYRVWGEDVSDAGLRERSYDVNLWGAAGIILTGYQGGEVEWREFLSDGSHASRSAAERRFALAMRDLAAAEGELVALPRLHAPQA